MRNESDTPLYTPGPQLAIVESLPGKVVGVEPGKGFGMAAPKEPRLRNAGLCVITDNMNPTIFKTQLNQDWPLGSVMLIGLSRA